MTHTFVYAHPIKSYIFRHLKLSLEQFCERYNYNPEIITNWTSYGQRIESLPASFIYDLSNAAQSNMSDVYHDLLILQDDYDYFTSMYG